LCIVQRYFAHLLLVFYVFAVFAVLYCAVLRCAALWYWRTTPILGPGSAPPHREEYVLLQPKFVLPEFFMHVQFPALENGVSSASAAAAATKIFDHGKGISPLLTLPPDAQVQQQQQRKPDGSEHGAVFPLENMMFRNALAAASGSSVEQQPQPAPMHPQEALMKKQHIVESLQRAVVNFKGITDTLLCQYAAKIRKNTSP
jgi:hypothetical protein